MLLEARDLTKSYRGQRVLDRVSLSLQAGQHLALVGASGCGKSTLLRILNGLLECDEGQVLFQGKTVEPAQWGRVRRQMGYVLQEGGLFPHLRAGDNLALLARDLGWNHCQIQARQLELMELLRLPSDLLGRFPGQLSGGQRQRISLARALFLQPPLVLMDEPLGALDPVVRKELQDDLKALFVALGCGLIIVTHDLAEAAHFGHHLVLLNAGRIVSQGSYGELQRSGCPNFEALVKAHRALPCG